LYCFAASEAGAAEPDGAEPDAAAVEGGAAEAAVLGAVDAPGLEHADAITAMTARPASSRDPIDLWIIDSPPLANDAPIWPRRPT
jgi:hypothetical protein